MTMWYFYYDCSVSKRLTTKYIATQNTTAWVNKLNPKIFKYTMNYFKYNNIKSFPKYTWLVYFKVLFIILKTSVHSTMCSNLVYLVWNPEISDDCYIRWLLYQMTVISDDCYIRWLLYQMTVISENTSLLFVLGTVLLI